MIRLFCLALALGLTGCTERQSPSTPQIDPRSGLPSKLEVPPQLDSLIVQNEKHARALAKKLDLKVAKEIWSYFRAGRGGNYPAMIETYQSLRPRTGQYEGSIYDPTVGTAVWQLLLEVELALEAYTNGAAKWPNAFGQDIVKSIPPGSIYFGGTDPGRGLPTAFSKSRAEDDLFFTLSQNPLVDDRYHQYLRFLYGGKIQLPSEALMEQRHQEYVADARKRLEHDRGFPDEPRQIKPGEDVRLMNNQLEVSGQVAVFGINSLLSRDIFDMNPQREFYIEESYPIDWMYPHLTPHGLIFKLNRKALSALPPELVAKDREFWTKQVAAMLGEWLTPDTPVKAVCDFVEKVFLTKDLSGFQGDPAFVSSLFATKTYSKQRSNIAGLYQWRFARSNSAEEKQRMDQEADFAFRQAFALCPISPEAIFRYTNLLVQGERYDDALLIARTALKLNPSDPQIQNLITELERIRGSQPK